METIDVLIVDDEPIAREILVSYLAKMPGFELAGECRNALEAFQVLNRQQVGIMLLDIQMPEINGMDFLKALKNPPHVIFTTAYADFAVQSYELHAVDYLLKPVSFERFLKAMNRAAELAHAPLRNGAPKAPAPAATGNAESMLFVRSEGKWIKVDLTELWMVEGLKDYVRLWTGQGKVIVHSTMKNFTEQLASYTQFVRIQKSFIVNLHYITEVNNNAVKVKEEWISIGNTYRDEVDKLFKAYKFI